MGMHLMAVGLWDYGMYCTSLEIVWQRTRSRGDESRQGNCPS